ncbi:MAG: ABC transporter permease [Actinomycetota bacterium]
MWRTTVKGLMAHKLRLALTALAVVLGVGFIGGTYVLTDTINKSFDELFSDTTQGIDVFVRSETAFESQSGSGTGDREAMPEEVLETVREIEGVENAAGSVGGYAQLVDKEGDAIAPQGPPTLGFGSPDDESAVNEDSAADLRAGRVPSTPDEVMIDAATAEDYDFSVGDSVDVLFEGPKRTFEIVGIVGFGEADNLGGATLAVFELEAAQELFSKEGKLDSIEVTAGGGVSAGELRNRIAAVLPDGVEAQTGSYIADEQSDSLQEALGFFNTALLVFGFISLFVGAFIIFNTFSIVVAQRTREFGLLRAMGATGRQILGSVLAESVIVGFLASLVGLAAGFGIAAGLQAMLRAFGLDLPSTGLVFEPRTAIIGLTVGVLVTLISAIGPARRAARISPMAALRESSPQQATFSRRRLLVGVAVTLIGAAILGAGLFGSLDNAVSYVGLGAAVIFFGVATLSPLFAEPLARAIGSPIEALLNVPGKLARQNSRRNPKRTASTAAALMIGLALVSMVSIFAASIKATSSRILDENLKADFIVTTSSAGGMAGFSPEVAAEAAAQDEIGAVASLRYGEFRLDGASKYLSATDPDTIEDVTSLGVIEGDLRDLGDGGVFLSSDFAESEGLAVGEDLTMEFPAEGDTDVPVDGIFETTDIVGSDFLVSLETYAEQYTTNLDSVVLATVAGGASTDDARAAIDSATSDFPNVTVENQVEFKETQAGLVDQLLGLITALLALALIIALLGITNTLALSVFERTRELGLLRAVGMSRRQARSMIRWESVIIAVIGAVLGLVVGGFFGWALVSSLADEGISEFALPTGQLIAYVAAAGVAGIIAAIPPARRAARLNVLEAIATE